MAPHQSLEFSHHGEAMGESREPAKIRNIDVAFTKGPTWPFV